MKTFAEKYLMPVIIVISIILFIMFGKKWTSIGKFAYDKKKKIIDDKIDRLSNTIKTNNDKISLERDSISKNNDVIETIKLENEKFQEELNNAKNDHDRLDSMFADLL